MTYKIHFHIAVKKIKWKPFELNTWLDLTKKVKQKPGPQSQISMILSKSLGYQEKNKVHVWMSLTKGLKITIILIQ